MPIGQIGNTNLRLRLSWRRLSRSLGDVGASGFVHAVLNLLDKHVLVDEIV